ncbi:hypothetical protein E2C01_001785 [Portunus trituberculatus]|uniref:Uncharacterized protein n=1 Tax=Portunus trituberculatus TaxID=210409 RepID=A0A5B7CND9_PORTR|nr:hypothetical protein [Portunus trituberculatus]
MPHLAGISMVLAFFLVVGAQWWMGGWLRVLRREEFQVVPRPGVSTLGDHGITSGEADNLSACPSTEGVSSRDMRVKFNASFSPMARVTVYQGSYPETQWSRDGQKSLSFASLVQ